MNRIIDERKYKEIEEMCPLARNLRAEYLSGNGAN